MTLPDFEIERLAVDQHAIEPYDSAQLQPSSYDVQLGNTLCTFRDHDIETAVIDPTDQEQMDRLTERVRVVDGERFFIHPSEFILGVTREMVTVPNNMVCRLEGKSSLGRTGLAVHVTAGYIDPGFTGAVTLEIFNVRRKPIVLRPGMLIAQLRFELMTAEARCPYAGRYKGDREATASRYGVEVGDE